MPRRRNTKRMRASDPAGQGCVKLWIGPRTVPVRSGHEGKKAPEGPTPKPIPTRCEPGRFAVVRLRGRLHGGVEVTVRPKYHRPVTEGYCVVATRGGELPEVNCQSVTTHHRR